MKLNSAKGLFSIALVLGFLFLSNSKSKNTPESIVLQFNESFNSRDFNKVTMVLHPNLKTIDYKGKIVSTNRDEYLNSGVYFPAVFDTKWTIHSLKIKGKKVITIESDSSRLNDFLYDQPLKMKYEYTVENDQIKFLKYDTLSGYSELDKRGQRQYDKLFDWGMNNYPPMKNFKFKIGPEGAKEISQLLNAFQKSKK